MLFLIWLVVALVALALYLRQAYSKFSKAGVHNPSVIPFVGNLGKMLVRSKHLVDILQDFYSDYKDDRFIGTYEFLSPVVLIKDLELLKKITVKDFDHFVDRRPFIDDNSDPLFGRNLLSMKGDEWRDMRSALSPAFTSSKIRLMVPFMVEVGEQMIQALKTKINDSSSDSVDIEAKDLCTRYANDVIASCAFGLKENSQVEDTEFYMMSKKLTTPTFIQLIKVFGYTSVPSLMKKLNITLAGEAQNQFFRNVVLGSMKQREEQQVVRNDMIHLLMEAKKGNLSHESKETQDSDAGFATVEESAVGKKMVKREWTEQDLVAQAVLFLFAGFDTVSTAMAFLLHEMALNPDVQEKLAKEIDDHFQQNGGKLDYNSIQSMQYLDMVISELLRFWPAAPLANRACVKESYNLGKAHDEADDFILHKGDAIQFPIISFHRDPKYFENPMKFDPEKFSKENKHKIRPFTYMPFGLGPRNCIGSRFALCEMKVMTYQLFKYFEVSPCAKTSIPTKLAADGFTVQILGGHWMKVKTRDGAK